MADYRYSRLIAFHTTLPISATAKIWQQELREARCCSHKARARNVLEAVRVYHWEETARDC